MAAIISYVVVWVTLACAYLVLAGSVDTVEMVAALVCASLGTGLTAATLCVSTHRFAFAMPAKAASRPFLALVPESLVVGRDLFAVALNGSRGQRGDFVRQPFDPGVADAASTTRRAAAVIGISLAPRSFVVRGDRDPVLILHALPAIAPSADHAWPA